MRLFYVTAVLLFLCLQPYAQMPQVYLKPKQSQALGALAKTAPLIVVIENEKSPADAAVITALKEQWTHGPVKYMSGLEFAEKFKSNTLDPKNLYLFNNYTREYAATAKIIASRRSVANIPAIYQGYYLTNAPVQLINAVKYEKAPPYLYFSGSSLADKKGVPIQGFYSLMIKHFNHDINYCQDDANFKSKKKNKRRSGIYFFAADSIANKTLLLVKEQTAPTEKPKDPEKTKNKAAKQDLETDRYTNSKKPVIVFPEDIEYAVKKNDADILLYSGGSLYSAADGSVYATIKGKQPGNGGVILQVVSSLVTVAVFTIFIIQTRK